MFYLWIILAPVGVLALLVGMGLGIPKKRVELALLSWLQESLWFS